MRNRIMHMKQFNLVELYHIHQFGRQSQFVRLKMKQWVFRYIHLMKMYVFGKQFQPNRLSVSDKMNFVTFFCQSQTEFSGYYSAPTESRITYNGYFHFKSFLFSSLNKLLLHKLSLEFYFSYHFESVFGFRHLGMYDWSKRHK